MGNSYKKKVGYKMLKHIVMWRLAENAQGKTKQENMEFIKTSLLALQGIIPQIKSMEIGFDVLHSEMSFDMALIMEFNNVDEMKEYSVHPAHQEVSNYVAKVRIERATVDLFTT